MSDLTKLWCEKYRPSRISDYLFQNAIHKKAFLKMVKERSIPHLLLSGVQGSGKTSLSKVLVTELDLDSTDVLTINASDENSVDVIRDKIKAFISTFALGPFKVVQLEECDYITLNGQGVLRQMMEEYVDQARFILTCNYEHKVIPAIKSRCQHYHFKSFDRDDVAERIVRILIEEKVKFTLDLVDKYVSVGYPDIRKIINLAQQNSIEGSLQSPTETDVGDYKFKLIEMIEGDHWVDIRLMLCSSVAPEEWEDVYRFLYENLHKAPKFSKKENWESGIITIAEYLYRNASVADPEINFAAFIIQLNQ